MITLHNQLRILGFAFFTAGVFLHEISPFFSAREENIQLIDVILQEIFVLLTRIGTVTNYCIMHGILLDNAA